MAMKQTQTKLFDYSDIGLDFCSASMNLMQDRLKKVFATGYNEQTVTSVSAVGNRVTLSYGGVHGYVQNRVLKINSGQLASINGGEFWIDSVTTDTVTFTLDDVPSSAGSGFTTKVASLGWELLYEVSPVHIYKFKALDESDLYLRLCFQTITSDRNCIGVCVGKSVDISTGVVTDVNSIETTRSITSLREVCPKWEFAPSGRESAINYTYNQGFATYGRGMIVGSKYHVVIMGNRANAADQKYCNAILPASVVQTSQDIQYPCLWCYNSSASNSSVTFSNAFFTSYLGKMRTTCNKNDRNYMFYYHALNAYLPTAIENFNTTVAEPFELFEYDTWQPVGYISAPIWYLNYPSNATGKPAMEGAFNPEIVNDVEQNLMVRHIPWALGSTLIHATYLVVGVEEVKIV